MDKLTNADILADVAEERDYQKKLWGTQRHDFSVWMTVLGEEFGEACKALLEVRVAEANPYHPNVEQAKRARIEHLRKELIQVAAVAVAAIEHIDEELRKE